MRARHSSSVERSSPLSHSWRTTGRARRFPREGALNTSTGVVGSVAIGTHVGERGDGHACAPANGRDLSARRVRPGSAARTLVRGKVAREAPMVGAPLVPHRDVVLRPAPPALQVRIVEARPAAVAAASSLSAGRMPATPRHVRTAEGTTRAGPSPGGSARAAGARTRSARAPRVGTRRRRADGWRRPRCRGRARARARSTSSCSTGESASVRRVEARPQRVATHRRRASHAEDGDVGRLGHEGDVGVPTVRLRGAVGPVLERHELQVLTQGPRSPTPAGRTPTPAPVAAPPTRRTRGRTARDDASTHPEGPRPASRRSPSRGRALRRPRRARG